ncbi:hypothetical protein RIF23_08525 [Lipingzhangella sp. LS1_29]|uniref:Uncharacterized protein n=1 Tax=Lipingzhangella rawalii TaxID=2055835 RepID=A0ABU2H4W5_9ACTN|nr:hypothetical protein [Lipingzhangella rawalii]MDS1270338.1 hypothetical protein [Lipingzhangella rawalii]
MTTLLHRTGHYGISVLAGDHVLFFGRVWHLDHRDGDPLVFYSSKGTFGVVTAMVIDLFPVARVYGGGVFFPAEHAESLLRTDRGWAAVGAGGDVRRVRIPAHTAARPAPTTGLT